MGWFSKKPDSGVDRGSDSGILFLTEYGETTGLIDRLGQFDLMARQAHRTGDKATFHRMMAAYAPVWDETQGKVNAIGRLALADAMNPSMELPAGMDATDMHEEVVQRFARHTGDLQEFMMQVSATDPQFLTPE